MQTSATSFKLIDQPVALLRLVDELAAAPTFAIAVAISSGAQGGRVDRSDHRDQIRPEPLGLGLATAPDRRFFVPLRRDRLRDGLHPALVKARLKTMLADPRRPKIVHDLKNALHALGPTGITGRNGLEAAVDTMLCSYLLQPELREHDLSTALRAWSLADCDPAALVAFDPPAEAALAAAASFRLHEELRPRITAAGLETLLMQVEMPLVPVVSDMEKHGVFVESWALAELAGELGTQAAWYEEQIHALAAERFNVNSPTQLATVLYDRLRIHESQGPRPRRAARPPTDCETLRRFAAHPLVQAVIDYRAVAKLKGSFADSLIAQIHPRTGRIHTSFHQAGTVTGRLSSSGPNLQNIPARTDLGREIRRNFRVSAPGHLLIAADYSQIELRLLAHMAAEPTLTQAFRRGEDVHTATAARLFRVPPSEVTSVMRGRAKQINFGIIYGMSPFRLAAETGLSARAAKAFIGRYFETYPGIRRYIAASVAAAKKVAATPSRASAPPASASRSTRACKAARPTSSNWRWWRPQNASPPTALTSS
jgi:DNA polymerase-1